MLKHAAAAGLVLFATTAIPAGAAPYMIVGNDEKPGTDPQGKPMVNPTGSDTVVIFDLAKPEDPKVVVSLKLENSVVGPPTNLAISPNGSIALVADSMTVAEDNGARKMVPTDKLFVIDMKASPPKLAQTLTVGKQPSGLSFSPQGRYGAGVQPRRRHHQRGQDRRHQRDPDRYLADRPRRIACGVHARRQASTRGEVARQQGCGARCRGRQGQL